MEKETAPGSPTAPPASAHGSSAHWLYAHPTGNTHIHVHTDHTYDARVMRPCVPTPLPSTPCDLSCCAQKLPRPPGMARLRPVHPAAPPGGARVQEPRVATTSRLAPGQAQQTLCVKGQIEGPGGFAGHLASATSQMVAARDHSAERGWLCPRLYKSQAWPWAQTAAWDRATQGKGSAKEPFSTGTTWRGNYQPPRACEHLKRGQCEQRTRF